MPWWEKIRDKLSRFDNLRVLFLSKEAADILTSMANRNMELQVTIQDGQAWVSSADKNIAVTLDVWK
jgi:uncharacterized protein YaeQ